jgi:hypothetical protein
MFPEQGEAVMKETHILQEVDETRNTATTIEMSYQHGNIAVTFYCALFVMQRVQRRNNSSKAKKIPMLEIGKT